MSVFFQTEYAEYMRILIEEHSLKSLADKWEAFIMHNKRVP